MMRLTPGTGAGRPGASGGGRSCRSGGGALRGGAVGGEERRDAGDAGQGGDRRLGGGAHRLERGPCGGVDLEHEAHPVALDGQRPDEVGVDDAAAAGHLHRAERGETASRVEGIGRSLRVRSGEMSALRGRWQGEASAGARAGVTAFGSPGVSMGGRDRCCRRYGGVARLSLIDYEY